MIQKLLKKLPVFLIVGLILGVLFGSSIILAETISQSDYVNEADAAQAALDCIENNNQKITEWDKATISEPVIYYAPDLTESAYEFTVLNDGKGIGYIIVSARKDWMPILERDTARSPSSFLSDAKDVAIEKGYIDESEKSEPLIIYWGACSYSAQFDDNMKNKGTAIQLTTGITVKIPKETVNLLMDKNQAREAWSTITNNNSNLLSKTISKWFTPTKVMAKVNIKDIVGSSTLSLTSVYVSQVPPFYQTSYWYGHGDDHDPDAYGWPTCAGTDDDLWDDWDGCAPISGAMVLGYWSNMGYTEIPDPDISGTEDTLIDDCHSGMSTTVDGDTDVQDIEDGMQYIANEWYFCDFNDIPVAYSWNTVKTEINNDYPFILSVQNYYVNGEYIDHAMCAYGYVEDGATHEIRCFNTWNTSINYYVTENNWTYARMDKFHP